jgi:hypothetical protein
MDTRMIDATVSIVVDQVLKAYSGCGTVAFAYGQGSTFCGFELDADLDIIVIWADDIPADARRPARQLCDPGVTPVQFATATSAVDNLVTGKRDTQVMSHSRSTFDSWCEMVRGGEGWRGREWPLPLHSIAGFAYGMLLADDNGEAAAIRDRISVPSAKLRNNTHEALVGELPEYRKALNSSAHRGEGWLFHELTVGLVKHAYASWFAAEGYYLPFPKHLDRWITRLDLDRELARREQLMWRTADLIERQQAILEFVEGVVALGENQSAGNAK